MELISPAPTMFKELRPPEEEYVEVFGVQMYMHLAAATTENTASTMRQSPGKVTLTTKRWSTFATKRTTTCARRANGSLSTASQLRTQRDCGG